MAAPGFWDAPEAARDVIADANQLKAWVEESYRRVAPKQLIAELNSRLHITSIAVTHDIVAARTIADRVAFLHQGRFQFVGTFDEAKPLQAQFQLRPATSTASRPSSARSKSK